MVRRVTSSVASGAAIARWTMLVAGMSEMVGVGIHALSLMDALVGDHSYPSPVGPPQWEERGGWGKDGHHETRCTGFEGPCSCRNARDPWTGEYVNAWG